jgi:hypothetical protein
MEILRYDLVIVGSGIAGSAGRHGGRLGKRWKNLHRHFVENTSNA